MSDDNVVPFQRPVPPAIWSDGRVQTECDELVHLFASVPGWCQCGERQWETVEWDDGRPGVIFDQEKP